MQDVIEELLAELGPYRLVCPAVLSPARIVAIARIAAGLSVADLAGLLGVSRSYLAMIEAGTRSLPASWSMSVLGAFAQADKLVCDSGKEGQKKAKRLKSWAEWVSRIVTRQWHNEDIWSLITACGKELESLDEAVHATEVLVRASGVNLSVHIENLCYQYLTSVFLSKKPEALDVAFEPLTKGEVGENLVQSWSALSPWPDLQVPSRVITPSPLLAWIAGAATTEEMIAVYNGKKRKAFLLADRKSGFVRKDPSVLTSLVLFLFSEVACVINPTSDVRKVDVVGKTLDGQLLRPLFVIGDSSGIL